MPTLTTAQAPGAVPEWTVGDRLRRARVYSGHNTRELADLIGVSHGLISLAEANKRKPRTILLRAWARATGVDEHWLTTEHTQSPRPENRTGACEQCAIRDSNPEPSGSLQRVADLRLSEAA